jgi:hypothetical protein
MKTLIGWLMVFAMPVVVLGIESYRDGRGRWQTIKECLVVFAGIIGVYACCFLLIWLFH